MWGVLVALLLVSTAISEDVVSTTSVSPLDVKDTEEPTSIKASRRSSSDNVPVVPDLQSSASPTNSETDNTPLLRALQISTPPALLQPPNHAEISLPDLSKYLSPPVEAVAKSLNNGYNVQDQSHYYSTQSFLPDLNGLVTNSQIPGNVLQQQPTYDLNVPLNHVTDYSKYYSTNTLLPGLYDQILQSQSPKYNLLQSMFNYPINSQNTIHCQDHSGILYKIWLILSTILESREGSRVPHANQIKYALMLISKYLEESNNESRNPNDELKLKLMLLEAELEKERAMTNAQQHFYTWLNKIPGLTNNLPKLPLPYEALNSAPMLSKCKDAFTRLLQWAQASYENILKNPDCYSNHINSPVNYGGSHVAFDIASNPYVRIPYSNYNYLNQYSLNSAPYTFGQVPGAYSSPLFSQLNQHTMNSHNLNTQWMTTYDPSLITQPNQNQPSIAPNDFLDNSQPQIPLDIRSSSYLPSSYLYESTAMKKIPSNTLPQITEPKKSYPAQILQTSSIYQKEQPVNAYIPVTRESVPIAQYPISGSQIPNLLATGRNDLSPVAVYNDFATNLQNLKGLTNRIPADNVHQQVNLHPGASVFSNGVVSPQNSGATETLALYHSYKAPSSPPTLHQNAMRGILQNLSSSQGYRDNIQNYLSSQNFPSSTNVPQQYGTYKYASHQSVPSINNAFPSVNQFKGNLNIPTSNNLGINQNLYQGAMPAQQYGTYSHYSYQTAPYINSASLPVTQFKENMYVPAAIYMQNTNQNLYQGTWPMDKAFPTIDWYSIANSSNLNPNYTPNGEVELTYAVRRPMPTENQPLYFIKYRIPYDVFMQHVRSLLSRRSDKPDLSKDLVLRYNASEIPKELASFPKEEVTEMVVKEGDLMKAKYIETDDSDNDTVSSAADSINALLNKTINTDRLDELNPGLTDRNDLTRALYENANQHQYEVRQPPLYQGTVNTNQNTYGMTYPSGVNPFSPGSNGLGLQQIAVPNPFNSGLTRPHITTTVQKPLDISRNF